MKKFNIIWILVLILLVSNVSGGSENFTIDFVESEWNEVNNGISVLYDSGLIVSGSSYQSGSPTGTDTKNTLVYSQKNFNNSYNIFIDWAWSLSCYVDADSNAGQNSNSNAGMYITDGENKTAIISETQSCVYTGSSATKTVSGSDSYRIEINDTLSMVYLYNSTGSLLSSTNVSTYTNWYLGANYGYTYARGVSGEFAYASVSSTISSLKYEIEYPAMFFNIYSPLNGTFVAGSQYLNYSFYNMGTTACGIDVNSDTKYSLTGLTNGQQTFLLDEAWMPTQAVIDLHCNDTVNFFDQTKTVFNGLLLNVTFKDEATDTIFTSDNVTVEFVSPSAVYNFTTDNGSIAFNIVQENYKVFYSADGFPVRERDLTITGDTDNNIVLYLANFSNTIELKMIVLDQYTNRVPQARIEVQKKFTSDNTFKTIVDLETNVNGEAFIDLVPETDLYRYIVYYENEVVWNKSATNGEILSSSQVDPFVFTVFLGEDIYELSRLLNDVTVTWNNNNTGDGNVSVVTGSFSPSFVSGTSQQICFRVMEYSGVDTYELYNQCVTSTTGTFSVPYTITQSSTLTAIVYLTYEGDRYVLSVETEDFVLDIPNPFGGEGVKSYEGWFFCFLILVLAMLMLHKQPPLVPIFVNIAFVILIKTNLIFVSSGNKNILVTVSTIISFWLMYLINKE